MDTSNKDLSSNSGNSIFYCWHSDATGEENCKEQCDCCKKSGIQQQPTPSEPLSSKEQDLVQRALQAFEQVALNTMHKNLIIVDISMTDKQDLVIRGQDLVVNDLKSYIELSIVSESSPTKVHPVGMEGKEGEGLYSILHEEVMKARIEVRKVLSNNPYQNSIDSRIYDIVENVFNEYARQSPASPEDQGDLKFIAMNIVNQLFDIAEVPVKKRQEINDTCDEFVLKLLRKVKAEDQGERLRWVKCDERLPEYFQPILIWNGKFICQGSMEVYKSYISSDFPLLNSAHVTHWMPLPKAPEAQK